MARRLLALIAAVAMVLIAVTVRDRLDDGDSDGGGGGSGPLRLVCATELQAVCDEIDDGGVEVTIEPAAVTADRLKSATPENAGIDGWLAPGPWGEMVDVIRRQKARDALFGRADAPIARSPFALALRKTKRAALGCGTEVEFSCLGDAVKDGRFRLGMAADNQAEGVLADAALGAGHVKNSDFATNDLNETDLSDWLTVVDASVDRVGRNPGGRSFTEMLSSGFASADGFLSTEAALSHDLANAAIRDQVEVARLTPVATADVLFSPRRGDRGERLRDIVRDKAKELLRANGWNVDNSPQLPSSDGLPSAGVLQALREVT